jgi:SNF family Na+-dependent transporter
MGSFVAFVSTAIASFYTVIVGWCIYYFIWMLSHPLPETISAAMALWDDYQSSGFIQA